MTLFYKGQMLWGFVTGTARDGYIFDSYSSGLVPTRILATYSNGWGYEGTLKGVWGKVIGRYQNGFLYRGHRITAWNVVGRYQRGYVYKGTTTLWVDLVGRYKGKDEEGAALALYYLFR